jgi:antirestriction protein ArdC
MLGHHAEGLNVVTLLEDNPNSYLAVEWMTARQYGNHHVLGAMLGRATMGNWID